MISLHFTTLADLVNFEASPLLDALTMHADRVKVALVQHSYAILPAPDTSGPKREAARMGARFPSHAAQDAWLAAHLEDALAFVEEMTVEGEKFTHVHTRNAVKAEGDGE